MIKLSGLMQVGVGVEQIEHAVDWYAKALNFNAKVIDDTGAASLMSRYTGGKAYQRRAVMLFNQNGGGGLELWQFLNRTPQKALTELSPNQPGIHTVDLYSVANFEQLNTHFSQYKIRFEKWNSPSCLPVVGTFSDPFGNRFRIIDQPHSVKSTFQGIIGGVAGVYIRCRDLEKATAFYCSILGLSLRCKSLNGIALNAHNSIGGFSKLYGNNHLELAPCDEPVGGNTYENRFWGDPGLMHFCFEVLDFEQLKTSLIQLNKPLTVDSINEFQMEKSTGRFGYAEDPDKMLVEFVQVLKIPIIPKLNLYWSMKQGKQVPGWLVQRMCKPNM